MKRSCPFYLPQQVHPQLRAPSVAKRKQQFEQPGAKRFCTHACRKRKSESEEQTAKRMRLEEAESRTNMLVDAYRRIAHLEQIIHQLGIELNYYREKTSGSTYNTHVLAF